MMRGVFRGVIPGTLIGAFSGLACVGMLLLEYQHALHHGTTPAGAVYGPGELAWFLSFPFGLGAAYSLGPLACCGAGPVWHVIVFGVVVLNFMVIRALAGLFSQ